MIFFVIASVLFLDRFSKFLIVKNLALSESLPIIKGVFHLSLVHNRGAAFGILKNQVPLFIASTVIAVVLIYINLVNSRKSSSQGAPQAISLRLLRLRLAMTQQELALSLILAGALGNLIDRVFFGYVIDFLDFRVWPVFNVADSAITVGAVLLGWVIIFQKEIKNKCIQ